MGRIYFLMGKSCSGKDTIYEQLLRDPELSLKPVVGYTTRPIRDGEEAGREYHFVSREYLGKLREAGTVIECRDYNTVYGVWSYFTVDDGQINLEDGDFLYIGTLESYVQVVSYYGQKNVVPLYIDVAPDVRLERGIKRERSQKVPKYAEMCRRFLADEEDFSEDKVSQAGITNYYYNNDKLDKCYNDIKTAIGGGQDELL